MAQTASQETVYPWVRAQDILREGHVRPDVQIIDVRTPAEFGEVHVPGAMNVPLPDVGRHVDELKSQGEQRPIVLMCRTQNRIKLAYDQLTQAGVGNCHLLEGGIHQWKASGHPIVEGQRAISLEGQVRMVAGALIVLGVLLGVAVNSWFLVIPAGVGAGLFHAGYTDSCLMGTILAKLPFNRGGGPVSQT